MSATPSRTQVLHLYKQFIKNAKLFNDYNFREYFLRRARADFKQHIAVQDTTKLSELYHDGQLNLAMLKRQSIISQLYTFDKLVVEPLGSSK